MQKAEEKLHKLTLVAKHKKNPVTTSSEQFQTINGSESQNDITH